MDKVGVEQLGKIVEAAGEAVNVVHKITHGGGIWSALSLTDELAGLSGLNGDVVLAELKDVSTEERKALLQALKVKVSLSDPQLEAKIESGVDCLDEVVDFGFKIYGDVLSVKAVVEGRILEGKALIEKVKSLGN